MDSGALLAAGSVFAFSTSSDFTVDGTLDLAGFNNHIASLSGSGIVTNSGASLATLATGTTPTNTIFSGTITDGAAPTALEVDGPGTLILTGSNSFSGGLKICNCGVVQLGNGGTSGTAGIGTITDNGTLTINRSDNFILANDVVHEIGSLGDLVQAGSGTTILTGSNDYAGTTTISAGTLQVGNGGASGTLGTGDVTNNSALAFNRSDAVTYAGNISGTGTLTQAGGGALTLTGTSGYTGATTVSNGATLVFAATPFSTIASTSFVVNGASTLRFETLTRENISGTVTFDSAGGGTVDFTGSSTSGGVVAGGDLVIVSGGGAENRVISTSGAGFNTSSRTVTLNTTDPAGHLLVSTLLFNSGSLSKTGPGTALLTADNDYSSDTTISAGTLQIGNGGSTGSLGNGAVTNNAALVFNRSNMLALDNTVAGSGSLTQAGSGTTILTGDNSYGGTTLISSGTLQVGNGGTAGTLGSGGVTDNAVLVFNRSDTITISNPVSGSGALAKMGAGVLILTGANSYAGTTTITAGTLQIGNGGTVGTLGGGTITNNATLLFNRSDSLAVANAISGSGGLTQSGSGTAILTGSNSYSGATTVSAGTLRVGNGGTSGTLGGGLVTDDGTLVYNRSDTVTVPNSISGSGVFTVASGTVILTGSNSYGGGAIIASGAVLQVGNGGAQARWAPVRAAARLPSIAAR